QREAEPMLKKAVAKIHARIDVATLTLMTWIKREPKKKSELDDSSLQGARLSGHPSGHKKGEEKSFMNEVKVKISSLKPLGLPKLQPHKLPKIHKEPRLRRI
ncbi:hypothetical protein AX14_003482, partial [Amanita brunnescens Koide BX004]